MSISGWIAKQRNLRREGRLIEDRINKRSREEKLLELKQKNDLLREEVNTNKMIADAKSEQKNLRKEKFRGKLASFGINIADPGKKSKKVSSVSTGFGSPFSGGFGGNSPFSQKNLTKDSFGRGSMTGGSMGGKSPFQNIFSQDKPRAKKKKSSKSSKGKTIIIRV